MRMGKKTLIAVPCMQTVPTKFMRCLVGLDRMPDTYTMITESTLIHDARNEITSIAITRGFDRILWIDSDMVFHPDLEKRLSARLDEGKRMVCGLFVKRVVPTSLVIYRELRNETDPVQGAYIQPVGYDHVPDTAPFRVAACGFGAVMTEVSLLREVWDKYGPPFHYHMNLGEDMSFCWRVQDMGESIWCDPSVKVGHVGQYVFTDKDIDLLKDEGRMT